MRSILRTLLLFLSLLFFSGAFASYMIPSDVSKKITSTFGECRNSIDNEVRMIHLGIDISTNSLENTKIYAMDSGYLSKLLLNEPQYGNAIFINHPDGLTTVYAHLNKFSDSFLPIIRSAMVEFGEESCLEIEFSSDEFEVKKGEIIGLSGKTGLTEAPHCHVEFRDNSRNIAIDPLIFLKDQLTVPEADLKFEKIRIDGESFNIVNGGTYYYSTSVPKIEVNARIVERNGRGKYGVNKIQYFLNGEEVYSIYFSTIDLNVASEGEVIFGEESNQSNYWYRMFSEIKKSPVVKNSLIDIRSISDNAQGKIIISDNWGNSKEFEFRLKRR